jgi:glyoxylase-like metal-dependent hydrolase (beta-lactamase superfamily II)
MLTRRAVLHSFAAAAVAATVFPRAARAQTPAPTDIPGADTQDPLAAGLLRAKMGVRRLADNLFVLLGAGGNIALLDGPDGVVLVDAGLPDRAADVTTAVKAVAKSPGHLLINTHHHFDHAGGNAAVHALGCTIVAHKNARALLSKKTTIEFLKMDFDPAPEAARPAVTFDDALTLYANGETLALSHLPPAHTDNDVVIRFEKAGVLHTGDLFSNGAFPFIDASVGGSIDGMIAAEEKLLASVDDKMKIIPGHGPVGTKADLQAAIDMLKTARDKVKPLVDAGKSSDETVAAKPLAPLGGKFGKGFLTDDQFVALLHFNYTHARK